jgi:hypothetical protein
MPSEADPLLGTSSRRRREALRLRVGRTKKCCGCSDVFRILHSLTVCRIGTFELDCCAVGASRGGSIKLADGGALLRWHRCRASASYCLTISETRRVQRHSSVTSCWRCVCALGSIGCQLRSPRHLMPQRGRDTQSDSLDWTGYDSDVAVEWAAPGVCSMVCGMPSSFRAFPWYSASTVLGGSPSPVIRQSPCSGSSRSCSSAVSKN